MLYACNHNLIIFGFIVPWVHPGVKSTSKRRCSGRCLRLDVWFPCRRAETSRTLTWTTWTSPPTSSSWMKSTVGHVSKYKYHENNRFYSFILFMCNQRKPLERFCCRMWMLLEYSYVVINPGPQGHRPTRKVPGFTWEPAVLSTCWDRKPGWITGLAGLA